MNEATAETSGTETVLGPKGKPVKAPPKMISFPTTFKSLADIGYQAARYINEGGAAILKALSERGIDLTVKDGISDEDKAELVSGIALRKAEITPAYWARREGKDEYTTVSRNPPPKGEGDKWEKFDIASAMSFTSHEIGAMKETPNRKERIVNLRKDCSKYVSNTLGRLRGMAKAQDDKANGRGATKLFSEMLDEFFKALPKKAKAAAQRGDSSAYDEALLKKKIAAFKAAK